MIEIVHLKKDVRQLMYKQINNWNNYVYDFKFRI